MPVGLKQYVNTRYMHDEARKFTVFVKGILPEFFTNKKVLDVGSGDINGNNRFLFDECQYEGNDVIQAPNVTIVAQEAQELQGLRSAK